MQYFIVLSAVTLAASALPTDIDSKSNATLFNAGLAGFGASCIGGQGGAVWTVWDPWALQDAINSDAPRIIYVRGVIDMTQLFAGSPGVFRHIGPYKTLIGGDANAEIRGGGFRMSNQQHIIIQNIKFHNAISYAPGEQPDGNGGIISQLPGEWAQVDAIDINNSQHVWVDHCEFSDDPWIALNIPNNQRRHDGLIDIRHGSSSITISNNIFRNHNLVTLVGNADSTGSQDMGRLKVTFYLNWYQGTIQRNPRIRFGEVHVLNNLYTDNRDYGIGIGVAARAYVERNVFINNVRAWGFAAGTPNPMGFLFNDNNRLVNSAHDTNVPNNVNWHPSQYYNYDPLNVGLVEAHVRRYAGTW